MKKHIILMVIIASLFMGCSSDDGGTAVTSTVTTSTTSENSVALNLNETVVINKGQQLVPTSNDAKVEIINTVEGDINEVTLLLGSAKIVTP